METNVQHVRLLQHLWATKGISLNAAIDVPKIGNKYSSAELRDTRGPVSRTRASEYELDSAL